MKVKIEKEFIDKHTNELYKVGDTKEFKDARAKELLADKRNLVSEVKEETKKAEKKSVDK